MMNSNDDKMINIHNWCALVKPEGILRVSDPKDTSYGKFICEPLERGYGLTLGNALRRTLLSSLQGYAPVALTIRGVQHEFTSIPGVLEDVTDIVLNIKQLRFLVDSYEPQTVTIYSDKKGVVTASNISVNHLVKVVNPEQHILTLTEDKEFYCEIQIRMGKGYVPADMHENLPETIGLIRLDSAFSPILKVAYSVEQARVGQMTNYDKLILEVWTDGTLDTVDAVAYTAKILKEQLTVFVNFDEQILDEVVGVTHTNNDIDPIFYKTVEDLELSVRASNCLKAANVTYVGELVQRTEGDMLKTKNFGRKSLDEIKALLQEMGFGFGMKIENFDKKLQEWKRKMDDEA